MNRLLEALLGIALFVIVASGLEFLVLRKEVEPEKRLGLLWKLVAANLCLTPLYVAMFAAALVFFLVSGDLIDNPGHKALEALVFCFSCLIFPALALIAGRWSRRRLNHWLCEHVFAGQGRSFRPFDASAMPTMLSTPVLFAVFMAKKTEDASELSS